MTSSSISDCDNDGTKYKLPDELDKNNPMLPLNIMRQHIAENSKVLDVGCACGDFGVLLKKDKNVELYGLEYNASSVKIAMDTGAYKEVHRFDLDHITSDDFPQYHNQFDFIVCGDVLEHLRDPLFTLTILKTYLKPTGCILASIPNVAHMTIKASLLTNDFIYTPYGLLDKTHIHLFTYKSIAKDMASINLKIEACDFTLVGKFAWLTQDPYPLLSTEIQKFIYKDWHSYVCQYVVKMSPYSISENELFQHNLNQLNINELTAPFPIVNYRTQLLNELFLSDL